MAQAQTGLSQLPRPRNLKAFNESINRHYPAHLRAEGRRGSVLVDVSIDERGNVRGVRVVPQEEVDGSEDGAVHRAVLVSKDPRTGKTVEHVVEAKYDAAFAPAVEAALREVRFSPALRNGQPVAYTTRMGVEFAPPAGAR